MFFGREVNDSFSSASFVESATLLLSSLLMFRAVSGQINSAKITTPYVESTGGNNNRAQLHVLLKSRAKITFCDSSDSIGGNDVCINRAIDVHSGRMTR